MSEDERAYLRLVNARIARMQPTMARAWRKYFQLLADEMGTKRAAELIATRRIEELLNDETLQRITAPLREELQASMKEGFRLTLPDISGAVLKNQPQIFFDVLNPRVTRAIEGLESRTLDTLKENARQVLRETVSAGLKRGEHPNAISRELRQVIGLSEQQARFVRNMGDDLDALDERYFTRSLRDKRYDATVRKAIRDGKSLTGAQRETITGAYARKYTKYNAELNTRAATLDSYRLAQWEAYASAQDRGIYEPGELQKVWIHFDPQDHPREDHKAWHGTTVAFNEPFPDGQQQAGLGYYNCRCSTQYKARRATKLSETRLRRNVNAAIKEFANEGLENVAAFGPDGRELFRTVGTHKSVRFTTEQKALLKSAEMVHNHPSGAWGMSLEDFETAIKHNLSATWVTTPTHVSRLLRPPNGWGGMRTYRRVERAHDRLQPVVSKELWGQYRAETLTSYEVNDRFYDELMTRVAREVNLDYRSYPRDDND